MLLSAVRAAVSFDFVQPVAVPGKPGTKDIAHRLRVDMFGIEDDRRLCGVKPKLIRQANHCPA